MVINKNLKSYDSCAEQFAKRFESYGPYHERVRSFQQNHLCPDNHILDLGCGPGLTARQLLDLDPSYQLEGVDLSPKMIALAQQRVPEADFRIGNILDISTDTRYDAVIASFCIVHLTDRETEVLIQHLPTLLKPKGALYLSFMTGKTAGLESTSFSAKPIFFNYYEPERIHELLVRAGFDIQQCQHQNYTEENGASTTDVFIFAQLC